jgi:predicted ATPase/DNA-binding CsgD family transcriptional regulator
MPMSQSEDADLLLTTLHQLTPFVGRAAEYAQLLSMLHDPACRVVSIIGPGGVGKTRLAIEAARALLSDSEQAFVDGVVMVSLAALPSQQPLDDLLATAIARALGFAFSGADAPTIQLRQYLRPKAMLLLVDNFEHLLPAAPFLGTLPQSAPTLSLLITSRAPLQLRGERCIVLEGLRYPDEQQQAMSELVDTPIHGRGDPAIERLDDQNDTESVDLPEAWPRPAPAVPPSADPQLTVALESYAAIQLFVQIARMSTPDFALTPSTAPPVARICRLVGGLPLGIELAASWLHVLSCAEIADELAQNLDLLAVDIPDLPARQRSLRTLFDSSWKLLSSAQQQALRRLAVFQGSFTREAAAAIADVGLAELATLVRMSLVRRVASNDPGRYEVLEVLRPYAAEYLEQSGDAVELAQRHTAYYGVLLAARTADLRRAGQQAALAAIDAEIAQIRQAWQWAVSAADHATIGRAADALFHFYDMRSWFREGAAAFAAARQALSAAQADHEVAVVLGKVLARQGWFTFHTGHPRQAQALLEQSLALLRTWDARAELIFPLNYLGAVCAYLGDYATTQALCQESLAITQAVGDQYGRAIACNILGQAAYNQGQHAVAQAWSQQSLAIEQQLGNHWSMAYSLANLGKVAYITGAYAEARRLFDESLRIRQAMGDRRGVAVCFNRLGETAVALGAYEEASERYNQSLPLFRAIGDQWGSAATLINLGHLALTQGHTATALPPLHEALRLALELESLPQVVTLLATCAPLIRARGDRSWAEALDQVLAAASTTLEAYQGQAHHLLAWISDEGTAASSAPSGESPSAPAVLLPPQRSAQADPRAPRPAPASYPAELTAREVEVLRLVAQGLTDAQVADQLIISRRTVSTHLSAIYGKLQVNSRSAATRFAIEHGLG